VFVAIVNLTLPLTNKIMTKRTPFSFIPVLALFLIASLSAQAAVEVQNVNFRGLRNDWVQVDVQLITRDNQSPDARSRDFVENVGVRLFLAYENRAESGSFDFYSSEVEILIMERGDNVTVPFFLAGPVVKRDRLPKGEPFAYIVEISVNGTQIPGTPQAVSSRIRGNPDAVQSMLGRAGTGAAETEGLLMPSYFAPLGGIGARVGEQPVYLRRDGQ